MLELVDEQKNTQVLLIIPSGAVRDGYIYIELEIQRQRSQIVPGFKYVRRSTFSP
jgi:hypothetical protein